MSRIGILARIKASYQALIPLVETIDNRIYYLGLRLSLHRVISKCNNQCNHHNSGIVFLRQWELSSLAVGTSSGSENSITGSENALCISFPIGKSPVYTNTFSVVGPSNTVVSPTNGKSSYVDSSQLPDDPNMPELEDVTYSDDEDDVGVEADFTNLETFITVSPIPTTRVHKDHPVTQIIGDLSLATQTRSKTRVAKDQGHTQEEGIDYEKVFAPVARIEAIRLFLAYASFMGFMVYQMDVKSDFLYGTIEEEVYVCQPPGFEDPDYPDKIYKVVKALYGLHQALRAWYENLANYILENGFQMGKIDQTLFIKRQKVKRILKYLKGKPHLGLWYPKDSPFNLVAYSDSDYAGASLDRKSTTGGCQFLGCKLISWKCKKQTIVATSSTEVALSSMKALKRILHVTNILSAGYLTTPQMVLNSPCLTHIKNWIVQIKRPLSWLVQKQTALGQTATGKEISNPFMADASEGFNQIIDFLNASSIKYALTINPNIYVSVIKQFWSFVLGKTVNDVPKLQVLVDKKKVIIFEATIRDALRLDDAEGIECLPNEEIFTELARMGYEKPSTKLTFYKAFFSSQWKFMIHTILQCMSAKRTSWNEFSSFMASAVICLSTLIKKQVGDLSSHTTKYSSPALTQKVFANMRRVGKGCSGVETSLFEGMIVAQQVGKGAAKVNVEDVSTAGVAAEGAASTADDEVPTAVDEPSIPSPPPPTQPPPPPSQDIPSTSQDAGISMDLLQNLLDTCTTLTRRVENLEQDKIAQALEITKLKQRLKKLERRNKASKLKRLNKVGIAQRIETSDDTVKDDVSKQDRIIADMDADKDVTIKDVATKDVQDVEIEENDEVEPAELQEVVEVVTTAKLIIELVTAASATITAVASKLTTVVAPTLTTAPSAAKRRNRDEVIDHVQRKEKKDNAVKRYQALKMKPQTEAQARKNMMIYLKNVAGFKMDYFKGMTYDDIRPIFKKNFNSNVAFLLKTKEQMEEEDGRALKRLSESQEDKAAKKNKLDEKVEELRKHLMIVPNKDDDVYTKATPLALKVPVVDYEIYTENNKPYYKIKRADGSHQPYLSFLSMLRNFDREDLEVLCQLVKERFTSSKPKNFSNDFLLTTLGAIFGVDVAKDFKENMLNSILVSKTVGEALAHSGWRAAMIEEMNALDHKGCILLVVYVDDIVITSSDKAGIKKLKSFISTCFQTKDLKSLKYLLGIEVSRSSKGICLSQRKYYLDLLDDAVRKLNYLTITHPDIAFPVGVVSQFLTAPRTSHWDVVTQILRYLKSTLGLGILYANHGHHIAEGFIDADYAGCPNSSRPTMRYYIFIEDNLVSWKSKKQNVVSRSSSKAEYRAMTQTTCELIWLRNLLGEIGFPQSKPMKMWCDNQEAIYIATNLVLYERTKHIEVDCHFTRKKLEDGAITNPHIRTESQLADVLTKALPRNCINSICKKLGMINIYAQLEGEC
uniref:Uncharacterized mitochondrial protein AtMg00810-like n=1 Tax=Tanacetum cinerariifolium TaxID=118510 RepID=A0A6L2K7L2_TANCI|nr:uncharacterized mitochondrial protein AtMg00810-like [Tanacetum cinerariifolium]